MIAKKILTKEKINAKGGKVRPHYNYQDLAEYIRDAHHEGEKCLMAWHEGCYAESYDVAIIEIASTQAMNTRAKNDKTYHLMISFRPEDETKLTPEAFKDIEHIFAEALGYEKHQRVCGVHKNTNNIHLHVAYNKINPDKYTLKEPYFDFSKLAEACRAVGDKYDIQADVDKKNENQVDQRAASMEAHAGEQSFQGYALERKAAIVESVAKAASWQDVHTALAQYGLEIKPQGAGLIVGNIGGKKNETIKASSLDRALSKNALEKRLGKWIIGDQGTIKPQEKYTRAPTQKESPARNTLYAGFQQALTNRKELMEAARTENARQLAQIKQQSEAEKYLFNLQIMARQTKKILRHKMYEKHRQDMDTARAAGNERLALIRKELPFYDWNGYLKWQANQGNDVALKVLQSKKIDLTAEADRDNQRKLLEQAQERERKIILSKDGSLQEKRRLISLSKMDYLVDLEKLQCTAESGQQTIFTGTTYTIDNRGIIIFALPSGGTIRDDGKTLYFSADQVTQKAASMYGQMKYGKNIVLNGNSIKRKSNEHTATNTKLDNRKPYFARIKQIFTNGVRKLSELTVVRLDKSDKVFLPSNARDDLER